MSDPTDPNLILLLSRIADTLERLEVRLEDLTQRHGIYGPSIRVSPTK